ncbi:hypothetical protein O6H91_Y214000 [Diphasiastrum complanatum]|nr:hypothetical protein O6H91_Y214000 [Diphasiastrum complanatum]
MNKELKFESISSIVENFVTAYQHSLHMVLKVRVGLPVEHNVDSRNYVCWRSLSLDLTILMWQQCCEALEKHAAQAKQLWKKWLLEGKRSGTQLTFGLPQKVEPNDPDDVAASKRTDTVSRQPGTIQSAVTAARTCSKISEHHHRKKTCASNCPPHKMLHSVPKRHARKDGMSNLSLCRGSVAAAAAEEPLISLNKVASCSNNTKKNKRANASATFAQRKFPLKYHSIELLSTTGITRIPAFFC